jgi:hypothetical protein
LHVPERALIYREKKDRHDHALQCGEQEILSMSALCFSMKIGEASKVLKEKIKKERKRKSDVYRFSLLFFQNG